MIRFAVIGQNWITRQFVEAARPSGKYKLTAVYPRSLEQAQHFANDCLSSICLPRWKRWRKAMPLTRCILPAPNALHFSQTQLFLSHKIHVI
ncbi:Gfo/Idh/MocA family oxidoreductase [Shigella flexneri]